MRLVRPAAAGALWLAIEAALLAALAWLPGLFFWRILTENPADVATFPLGDFTELHYPYRSWAAEALAAGRLPLWNPYVSAGHPALGDIQFGLLYPVGALFARLYGGDLGVLGLERQVIAHFSIALVGTYLFARVVGAARAGAIVAALVFGFGGYMTSFPVQQIIILQTSVWLPWILLGLELAVGRREPLAFLIVAGGTAMAALVGHPQTLAYVLGLALAYGIYRLVTAPSLTGLVGAGAGAIAGVALAAPALLPALEHLRTTARTDVGYQFTAHGFSAHEIIGLIFPTDFGGRPLFVGMLGVGLALAALALRRPGAGFWAGTAAVAVVLSLGGNAFLYPAAYALVPGLQFFRDHERAALIVSMAVAMLAGQGMSGLGRALRVGAPVVPRWIGLAPLTLAGGFGLFGLLLEYAVMTSGDAGQRNSALLLADRAFLTALFGLLAAGLLLGTRAVGTVSATALGAGAVALLAIELFTAGWQLNLAPGPPDKLLRPTATVQFLRSALGPLDRVASEGHLPADGNAGALFRIPDVVGNTPLELQSYRVFSEKVEEVQRWRLLGVRFAVTRRQIDDPRLPLVYRETADARPGQEPPPPWSTYELRNDLRLPRAWLVHRAVIAGSRDEELELVRRIKPEQEVVLSRAVGALDGRPPDRPAHEDPGVTVRVYDPEMIALRTWSGRDAVLVLAERDYPGWSATLDGQPVPLLRANYALRGIYVPAGAHDVVLRFEAPGFAPGQDVAQQAVRGAIVLIVLRLLLAAWSAWKSSVILRQRIAARSRSWRRSTGAPSAAAPAASESGAPGGVR